MSNGRIAVLCPTRGNPEAAEHAYLSMRRTSELADMIFCVDEDDAENYRHLLEFPRAWMSSRPRISVVNSLNMAVKQFSEYEAYGVLVDDARFMTPGWDRWLLEQFSPVALGVVSASHNCGRPVNHPYVHRDWVAAVGWYACPDTYRLCWDTVLEMLGEATRIVYAPQDRFHIHHEQLRPSEGVQAAFVDTFQFLGWCIGKRHDLVKRLRGLMDEQRAKLAGTRAEIGPRGVMDDPAR